MVNRKVIQLNSEKAKNSNKSSFSPISYTNFVGLNYTRKTDNLLNFSREQQPMLGYRGRNTYGLYPEKPSFLSLNSDLNTTAQNDPTDLTLDFTFSYNYISEFSSSFTLPGLSFAPGVVLGLMPMFPFSLHNNISVEPSDITSMGKKENTEMKTIDGEIIPALAQPMETKDGQATSKLARIKDEQGRPAKIIKSLDKVDIHGNTQTKIMEADINYDVVPAMVTISDKTITNDVELPVKQIHMTLERYLESTTELIKLSQESNNRSNTTHNTQNINPRRAIQRSVNSFIQITQNKQATGEELIVLLSRLKKMVEENPNMADRIQPEINKIETQLNKDKEKCETIAQSDFVKENNLEEHMKEIANISDMISREIGDTKATIQTVKANKAATKSSITIKTKKTSEQEKVLNQILKKIVQTFAEQQSKSEIEQSKKEKAAKEAIMKALNKKLDQKEMLAKKLVKKLEAKIEQLKDQNKEALAAKLQSLLDDLNSEINNNQSLANAA